jgi:hypothetical protein
MTALPPDSDFTGSVTEGQFKGSFEDMLAFLRGHLGSDGTIDDVLLPVRQLPLPNGGCAIAQRGQTNITGTVAAAQCDMWGAAHDGTTGTGTAEQVTTSSIGKTGYALQCTMPASTDASYMLIHYRLEAREAKKLQGGGFTIGVEIMHNDTVNRTPTIKVGYPASADDDFSGVTEVVESPTYDSYPDLAPMTPGTAWRNVRVSYPNFTRGMDIWIKIPLAAGKWVQVTNLRISVGNQDTGFVPRPVAADHQDCLRHFYKSFNLSIAPAQAAGTSGALIAVASTVQHRAYFDVRFPVPMRAAPTITTYNPSNTNADAFNMTGGGDTPIGGNNIGETGGRMYTDSDTGDDGDPMAIHLTADAGLY